MATGMTHVDSHFHPFTLALSNNGGVLTGICCLPPRTPAAPPFYPLMVGVHGGACTAHYFDLDAKHTASLASSALGIPFVAFNRPNYGDSSSFASSSGESSSSCYFQDEGRWLHEYVFPALWEAYGRPNKCTAIVALCHSTAVPSAIVATSLYATRPPPSFPNLASLKYPLAGLVLSGFGTQRIDRTGQRAASPPEEMSVAYEDTQMLMLSDPDLNCYDTAILKQLGSERGGGGQEHAMPAAELADILSQWPACWKQHAEQVQVPILYALGGFDSEWKGTRESVREFVGAFTRSTRVEAAVVAGAPHSLEWWWGSMSWYARCFGWGAELCTGLQLADIYG